MKKHPLNYDQRIALKYYKAYSALCGQVHDGMKEEDRIILRTVRNIIHDKYKEYEPKLTFDVSLDYPQYDTRIFEDE